MQTFLKNSYNFTYKIEITFDKVVRWKRCKSKLVFSLNSLNNLPLYLRNNLIKIKMAWLIIGQQIFFDFCPFFRISWIFHGSNRSFSHRIQSQSVYRDLKTKIIGVALSLFFVAIGLSTYTKEKQFFWEKVLRYRLQPFLISLSNYFLIRYDDSVSIRSSVLLSIMIMMKFQ